MSENNEQKLLISLSLIMKRNLKAERSELTEIYAF